MRRMLGVFARVLESNEARQGVAHHGYSVEPRALRTCSISSRSVSRVIVSSFAAASALIRA